MIRMEFVEMRDKLIGHFNEMTKDAQKLFEVNLDKDKMWDLYLDSFPAGTNKIFRERREHDCTCCKQFIRNIGNMVVIQDKKIKTIWDFKTKYLKPRLSVKPFKSGTYTVYVKMYKNGTLTTGSNSPTGYSYSDSVTISGTSQHTVYLDGWGSTTAGHWSAGNYRFEVWYDGYCIGSKDFRVI